ncbi:unnamed protein product [Closterium sp. Yama58-4]|nr:unnamed protein product [Closterium sp. Yama58-4]
MASSCFSQSTAGSARPAAGRDESGTAKAVRAAKAEVKRLLKTRRQDLGLWAAYARLEAESGNLDASRKAAIGISTNSYGACSKGRGEEAEVKSLLKTRRQDLGLWAVYAQLEAESGNPDASRKVPDTALASVAALPKDLGLWAVYARMEAESGNTDASRKVLDTALASVAALPKQSPAEATPFLVLAYTHIELSSTNHSANQHQRPQQQRQGRQKSRKGHLNWSINQHWCSLHTLASFAASAPFSAPSPLPPQFDPSGPKGTPSLPEGVAAAAAVMDGCIAAVLPGRRACCLPLELLFERYASLLLHALPAIPPQQVRRVVLQGLKEFPSNVHLLGTFLRLESRSAFTNSIRRFFDQTTARLSHPSPLLWLLSLLVEVARPGARPRVRGLLERALASSAKGSGQCVLMWRLYIGYELHISRNVDAARRVFFRAIHACPWSKALWLDAFTQLHGVIKGEELNELANMMRDKELRLRTDVYEILLQDAQ